MKADIVEAKRMVEEFVLTEELRTWALERAPSVPPDDELEAWRDRCRTNKYRTKTGPIADAAASWRTSMRNAEEWGTYKNRKWRAFRATARPVNKDE